MIAEQRDNWELQLNRQAEGRKGQRTRWEICECSEAPEPFAGYSFTIVKATERSDASNSNQNAKKIKTSTQIVN